MSTPPIPKHTCPLIDEVIDIIDRAFETADKAEDSDNLEDCLAALHDIRHILVDESRKLEPIRDANLALRTAAEYWQEKAEELTETVEKLERGEA